MPTKELSLPAIGTELPNTWITVALHRVAGEHALVLALRKSEADQYDYRYCVWNLNLHDMSCSNGDYFAYVIDAVAKYQRRGGCM